MQQPYAQDRHWLPGSYFSSVYLLRVISIEAGNHFVKWRNRVPNTHP